MLARVVALVLAAFTIGSCTATGPEEAAESSPGRVRPSAGASVLQWQDCGGRFQCSTLAVPVSYADPSGPTIDLRVVRLPATGRDVIGSLVINPGGPGSSGVEYARLADAVISPGLMERYDIVGFDPRGVAGSAPIECVSDAQLDDLYAADATPDSSADLDRLVSVSAELARGCRARSSGLLPHVGTLDAATDLDRLRAALGDDRLTYLGKSYGSQLGLVYAQAFPDRVGRIVLDGIVPPDLGAAALTRGQAIGFETALRRFVADCDPRPDCPLADGVDAGVAQIRSLLASLDTSPLPALPGRDLNEALATYAVLSYMYLPEYDWPALRQALGSAMSGDGRPLMDLLDQRIERDDSGSYRSNAAEAFYAISCLDRPFGGGTAQVMDLAASWARLSPTFGEYLAWGLLPCDGWPAADPLPAFAGDRIPPLLLVSTRWDPATPNAWAERVRGEVPAASLVVWEGDGHTAYRHGSSCIDAIVDAYLLEGTRAADGTTCR